MKRMLPQWAVTYVLPVSVLTWARRHERDKSGVHVGLSPRALGFVLVTLGLCSPARGRSCVLGWATSSGEHACSFCSTWAFAAQPRAEPAGGERWWHVALKHWPRVVGDRCQLMVPFSCRDFRRSVGLPDPVTRCL